MIKKVIWEPSKSFPIQSIIKHYNLPDRPAHEMADYLLKHILKTDTEDDVKYYHEIYAKVFGHLPDPEAWHVRGLMVKQLALHRGMI